MPWCKEDPCPRIAPRRISIPERFDRFIHIPPLRSHRFLQFSIRRLPRQLSRQQKISKSRRIHPELSKMEQSSKRHSLRQIAQRSVQIEKLSDHIIISIISNIIILSISSIARLTRPLSGMTTAFLGSSSITTIRLIFASSKVWTPLCPLPRKESILSDLSTPTYFYRIFCYPTIFQQPGINNPGHLYSTGSEF